MRRLALILPVLSVLLTFVSCGKDNSDEPASNIPTYAAFDFVTLVEASSSGSVLEMQKVDDSPIIRYTTSYNLASESNKLKVGERIIISYNRASGLTYTSGKILLYGYAKLSNTDQNVIVGTAEDYQQWLSPPVSFESIWRSGQYINMHVNLYGYKSNKPKQFILVADEKSITDPIPQLHLIYANEEGNDGVNAFEVYASFNISSLWDRDDCQGVAINYLTPQGMLTTTFMKRTSL